MEGLEEIVKPDAHLTSAAAFVEGGIQDAYDDACSICLEPFSDTDPSTVTNCKHEFHLQCVLEWCQRSSQCPMCWQSISMKDPTSQELLEAVEHERNAGFNQSRNSAIFRHPTLGDFELQHLPVGLDDADLEERIMQHLAAAAAMGRHHMARREGHRNRFSGQGHPQFLVFSRHPNAPVAQSISQSPTQRTEDETNAATNVISPSLHPATVQEQSVQSNSPQSSGVQSGQASGSASGSSIYTSGQYENSPHNRSPIHSSPNSQDRAGPSEISTFSESIKSKLNAVSMRYKESISKSTRGWKERFFSRNTTMPDLGSEVRKEVNAGLATVSRMMEHLETRDSNRTDTSASNNMENSSMADSDTRQVPEAGGGRSSISSSTANIQTSCAASGSN